MACRWRINGATRSGLRLVMQRLIPKASLGLFLAARGTFRDNQQFRRVLPWGNTPTQLPAVLKLITPANSNKNRRLLALLFDVEIMRAPVHDGSENGGASAAGLDFLE
jgi:hypothetical protein